MEEHIRLAFTLAKELTTQLITLATGIITVTATFARDYGKPGDKASHRSLLLAWVLYLLSILLGILTWMALVGVLTSLDGTGAKTFRQFPDNARMLAGLQIVFFFAATCFLLRYSLSTLRNGPRKPEKPRRDFSLLSRYRRQASDWANRR
jgi:hypothetical protein